MSLLHCIFNPISFKGFDRLVNAGGFDEMDVHDTSCYLRFMGGVTLGGQRAKAQNLVRYAIATSTPALTIIMKRVFIFLLRIMGIGYSERGEANSYYSLAEHC